MYPNNRNILVIENDPHLRGLIERILAEEGFAVAAAAEGFAALRALQGARFDLIVSAIDLPGALDGLTTVRRARAQYPQLKALFTAEGTAGPRWDNPDCDDFIASPFQRRELLGCVFELLQRDPLPGATDLARRCRAELSAY